MPFALNKGDSGNLSISESTLNEIKLISRETKAIAISSNGSLFLDICMMEDEDDQNDSKNLDLIFELIKADEQVMIETLSDIDSLEILKLIPVTDKQRLKSCEAQELIVSEETINLIHRFCHASNPHLTVSDSKTIIDLNKITSDPELTDFYDGILDIIKKDLSLAKNIINDIMNTSPDYLILICGN